MNKESMVLMRFYRLLNITRDCLELTINEGALNKEVIEARGKFFDVVIHDQMLVDFFNRSGENGQAYMKNLELLYQDVYVTKRMINIRDDQYFTDESSKVKLLDYIVGIYQSTVHLVNDFANDLKSKELLDDKIPELLKVEDDYYRALVIFSLFKTILKHNTELQNNLKESQGKASPQVNLILEELKKMVGMLKFVNEHYKGDNEMVKATFDNVFLTLKFLDGSIKATDPADINIKINEAHRGCISFIHATEKPWSVMFQKVLDEIQPPAPADDALKS